MVSTSLGIAKVNLHARLLHKGLSQRFQTQVSTLLTDPSPQPLSKVWSKFPWICAILVEEPLMAPPGEGGERTMKVGLSFPHDINIPVFAHSRVHSCAPARPSGCQYTQPLALRSRLFSGKVNSLEFRVGLKRAPLPGLHS